MPGATRFVVVDVIRRRMVGCDLPDRSKWGEPDSDALFSAFDLARVPEGLENRLDG